MSRSFDVPVKSYVASILRPASGEVKAIIVPSHWAVGYTKAHKATPEEAAAYMLDQADKDIKEAVARYGAVLRLAEELSKEADNAKK